MSLVVKNLNVLAYANHFTLWHYKTEDTNIAEAGYFNAAACMFNKGDLIISNHNTDGAPSIKLSEVTDATKDTVTVVTYSLSIANCVTEV